MSDQKTKIDPEPHVQYQFGAFTLDLQRMALLRDGIQVPLTPKVYEILVLLVRNHTRVLTKEELMKSVWSDSFVEDANLTQTISVLRRALGDRNGDGRFIETLPKRGYRFVAPVRKIAEGQNQTDADVPRFVFSPKTWIWTGSLVFLIAVSASIVGWVLKRAHPVISAGHRIRPFAADLPAQMYPVWSPDGKWLAFVQLVGGKIHLLKARADGTGSTVDLLEMTTGAMMGMILPEWSPAGDWIACGDSQNRLVLVHPDGNGLRTLGESGPVTWSRDGATLYQIRYRDRSLIAIDVATGNERILRDLGDLMPYATREPARRLTMTRDGSKVLYSVIRSREEIWMLEGLQPAVPWLARAWPW